MSFGRWQLLQGDAINRCLISPAIEERFAVFADHETMEDRVKYRFINGFVDVGDLPCRKIFWEEMAERKVKPNPTINCSEIHSSSQNQRIDYSLFRHLPTHIQRWAKVYLYTETAGNHAFSLATCGGVRIWTNQHLSATFTPFDRNTEHQTEIQLPLKTGRNEVLIHMEEICERDTQFYYELIKNDDLPLTYDLGEIDHDTLIELEAIANSVHVSDVPENKHFIATLSHKPNQPVRIATTLTCEQYEDMPVSDQIITPGTGSIDLPVPSQAVPLKHNLNIQFELNGLRIERTTGVVLPEAEKAPDPGQLEERKALALSKIAEDGNYTVARLLAILRKESPSESEAAAAERIALEALSKISSRSDCADFSLVPLLWAYQEHEGHPILSESIWKRIRSTILGFRYWLDEPGNDCMWFWSENHVLCFHAAQYLAGLFFPKDTFICSGRSGQEQMTIARERLNHWFDHALEVGMVEWNSSCYFPIDYIGLMSLYHFAGDRDLKEKTRTLMDRLMLMSAAHYQQGMASGTMGRVYQEGLKAGMLNEMSGFGYVAWGDGWISRQCCALPLFCMSDYEPPAEANELAHCNSAKGVEIRYTQGMDKAGKIVAWKQKDATLSTVVDHHTGQKGHQQHVVDIQLADDPQARIWINHPGEESPDGSGRPSFWGGNGILPRVAQHQNRAAMIYDLGQSPRIPYTHLHLVSEAMSEVRFTQHWCFVRHQETYVAVFSASPLQPIEQGLTAGEEIRAQGTQNAWYLVTSSKTEHGSFDDFVYQYQNCLTDFKKETLELNIHDPQVGVVQLNWQGDFSINGEAKPFSSDIDVIPVISSIHA